MKDTILSDGGPLEFSQVLGAQRTLQHQGALLGMKPTTLYSRILALGLRAKEAVNTNSRVA